MSWAARKWAEAQPLPRKAKALLFTLADFASDKTGRCYPSQDRLADRTGFSKGKLKRWTDMLEQLGLISRKRRYHDSLMYELHLSRIASPSEVSQFAKMGILSAKVKLPFDRVKSPNDATNHKEPPGLIAVAAPSGASGGRVAPQSKSELSPPVAAREGLEGPAHDDGTAPDDAERMLVDAGISTEIGGNGPGAESVTKSDIGDVPEPETPDPPDVSSITAFRSRGLAESQAGLDEFAIDQLRQAVDRYNDAARKAGWKACQDLDAELATKLSTWLHRHGGLVGWIMLLGRIKPQASDGNGRDLLSPLCRAAHGIQHPRGEYVGRVGPVFTRNHPPGASRASTGDCHEAVGRVLRSTSW